MIKSLSLFNFKAWAELPTLPIAPLTGLFGINSAGKSSIIQLLLLLKQTVESADRSQVLNLGDKRSIIDLGTFADIAHRRDASTRIEWEIDWTLPRELRVQDVERPSKTVLQGNNLCFHAEVGANGSGRIVLYEFEYGFSGHVFAMSREQGGRYELSVDPPDVELKKTRGRPPELPAPVKFYGFPDKVKASYQNAGFLSDFELAFEELFARVYYLGPLRDYPQREYPWGGADPSDMGKRGERAVDAILAAGHRGKYISPGPKRRKRTLEEHVAHWLRELGLIAGFRVVELASNSNLYRVLVRRDVYSPEVMLTDVGFGVSQVLPVLTLCYYVPEGSTIILEHPEIHLHPSVQAGLADVLVDAMRNRKVQIILESHSEHLLRRLQRRIAEEALRADEVALYFCGTDGGRSFIERLNVDLYGEITNWPHDFFGDEFSEIVATQKAALARKQAAQV